MLAADRPAVLDVGVDPSVPPLPPHTTWTQAVSFAKALFKGDPDLGGVLGDTLAQTFRRS